MKTSIATGTLIVACLVSCGTGPAGTGGGQPGADESIGTQASAIQGGVTDSTHLFAVGVVQLAQEAQDMVAFCSGVLLAPNLVATARHCVAQLTSTTIDCSTSSFGPLYPASDVIVTTDTTIPMRPVPSDFVGVTTVLIPPTGHDLVCGNDIALLILDQNITLPEYVTPVISPPMTDPSYQPVVTAIGYGVDTPTDTNGTSAGTRRSRSDVNLYCVPDDPNFTDCFTGSQASQAEMVLTAGEFVSGDSTCEGDSGSGAYVQASFDQGDWVAFGVLSRGGVSPDGQTCEQPIYTRFDAWGPLVVAAAKQAVAAATQAGQPYDLPPWANSAPTVSTADAGTFSSTSGAGTGVGVADGKACSVSTDCTSGRCALAVGGGSVCVSSCQDRACAAGFTCTDNLCFAASAQGATSSGCSAGAGSNAASGVGGWCALGGLLCAAAGVRRRRSVVRQRSVRL